MNAADPVRALLLRGLLILAAVGIFGAFFANALLQLRTIDQDVARDFSENLVLTMAQNEKRLYALIDAVHEYATGEGLLNHADLMLSLDLAFSRISVVREGELAERLVRVPNGASSIRNARIALTEVEPELQALRPGDHAAAAAIETRLRSVLPDLARATFAAAHADLARLMRRTEARHEAIRTVIWSVLGTLLSLGILLGLLVAELRRCARLMRQAQQSEQLARANEAHARESESLMRAIIDAVPALINVKDRESRYVIMNAYQGEVYGVDPVAAVGRCSEDFTGAYGAGSRALDREVIATGRAQDFGEREFVDRNGLRRIWWTAKAPMFGQDGRVAYVVTVALDATALKRAEAARKNLSRYFSPNVVELLAQRDRSQSEAAISARVAVLFADLHNFTRLSAHMAPADVLAVLRELHSRLTDAVLSCDGTLEKYLGDGLMATFGTPVATGRDATNALEAALAMQDALTRWNSERLGNNQTPLRLGIGLSYGEVVLGEIGTEQRSEYAVIGNTVNLASRLQSAGRQLRTDLVVSREFVDAVQAEARAAGIPSRLAELAAAAAIDVEGYDVPISVSFRPGTDEPQGRTAA